MKKKPAMTLVISVGPKMPKKPTDTATPDKMKKYGSMKKGAPAPSYHQEKNRGMENLASTGKMGAGDVLPDGTNREAAQENIYGSAGARDMRGPKNVGRLANTASRPELNIPDNEAVHGVTQNTAYGNRVVERVPRPDEGQEDSFGSRGYEEGRSFGNNINSGKFTFQQQPQQQQQQQQQVQTGEPMDLAFRLLKEVPMYNYGSSPIPERIPEWLKTARRLKAEREEKTGVLPLWERLTIEEEREKQQNGLAEMRAARDAARAQMGQQNPDRGGDVDPI